MLDGFGFGLAKQEISEGKRRRGDGIARGLCGPVYHRAKPSPAGDDGAAPLWPRLRPHRRAGAPRGPHGRVLRAHLPFRRERQLREHGRSDAAPPSEPHRGRHGRQPGEPRRADGEPRLRRRANRSARGPEVESDQLFRHDFPGHPGQHRQHRERRPDAVLRAERDRHVHRPAHRPARALHPPLQRRHDPAVHRVARPDLPGDPGVPRRAAGVRPLPGTPGLPPD